LEVLRERRDVTGVRQQVRDRLRVLPRRGAASLQNRDRRPGDELRRERLRVEVPHQELGRRAEVRKGEVVLRGGLRSREPWRAQRHRSSAQRSGQETPSIHLTVLSSTMVRRLPAGYASTAVVNNELLGGEMQISARNKLEGTVTSIKLGGVMAE